MLYNKEDRLKIAERVYTKEIDFDKAMIEYGLSYRTLTRYIHDYKTENGIKTKQWHHATLTESEKKTMISSTLKPIRLCRRKNLSMS